MPPDQDLPNIRASITPPPSGTVDTWDLAWVVVRFRTHDAWKIGIVRGKIRLTDGTWAVEIEYGGVGTKSGWHDKIWAAWDPRLIVPIGTDPPA